MSNDTKESPNLKCTSCGVPWADHMGIIGTCTENIKLRKENDALLFVVAKLEKESKEWNLRLQDPEPIQVLSVNTKMNDDEIWEALNNELYERRTAMTEVSAQIEKLTHERDEARRMYCHMAGQVMYRSYNKSTAEHIANNRNWDCYKKDETK